jgi:hypothetical protein
VGFLEGLLKSPDSGSDSNSHLLCDFTPRCAGGSQAGDLGGIHYPFRTPEPNAPSDRVPEPGSYPFLN